MFDTLTVVFHKDGHFHTVSLDGTYPMDSVEQVFARLDLAGYEIVSAIVKYDGYWEEEMVSDKSNSATYLWFLDLHELLSDNCSEAGSIIAYVHLNGIAYLGEWEDSIKYSGDTKAELAQEWFSESGPQLYTEEYTPGRFSTEYVPAELPYYLEIDWDASADSIANANGMSIQYLNGTWYMFS